MNRILLVVSDFESRQNMEQWLRRAGFNIESVATFEQARNRLTARSPDVLVTDVKLGDFNGLHLAIVGQDRRPTLVTIVVGSPDAVLEKEAERLGATYMVEPVTEEGLVAQVTVLLESSRLRRWPRKYVADKVDADLGESSARLLDVSYGGLRLEVADAEVTAADLGSDLRVKLPAFGVSVDAAVIWIGRSPSGHLLCGAALAQTSSNVTSAWRNVVDRIGFGVQ